MEVLNICLVTVFTVFNCLLFIAFMKNRRYLKENSVKFIDLLKKGWKGRTNSTYFLLLLALLQVGLILIAYLKEENLYVILIMYISIMIINDRGFYVGSKKIGKILKLEDTEGVEYIEIERTIDYAEFTLVFNDNREKKIRTQNKNVEGIEEALRDCGYEVYEQSK